MVLSETTLKMTSKDAEKLGRGSSAGVVIGFAILTAQIL
jgi:hypothetical protein